MRHTISTSADTAIYNGEMEQTYHIIIDGSKYLASKQEYEECEYWTDGDIADFLKRQLI